MNKLCICEFVIPIYMKDLNIILICFYTYMYIDKKVILIKYFNNNLIMHSYTTYYFDRTFILLMY